MPYYVRPMHREDVNQVTEIDREAFPTQWPPVNYHHELRNRLAHHIVACDDARPVEPPEVKDLSEKGLAGLVYKLGRLFNRNHPLSNELPPPAWHYIVGFAGFWVLADGAHITSIAVREVYRRRGIGELLLINAIELAKELKARVVTLEVRASNTTAQNLYAKYTFTQTGVHRGYYLDNREDGVVMSTQDITALTFQKHFQQLKETYFQNNGAVLSQTTG